ncbi:MAG: PEGA domain-containing protein [Patescibacteria group bacterium]
MGGKIKAVVVTIVICLLLFALLQAFMPDAFLKKIFNSTGTLRAESSPVVNVFLDSTLIGQTPLLTNLKDGVYSLKFVPEATSKETVTWSGRVRIFKNATTFLNRQLSKSDLLSAGEMLSMEKNSSNKGQVLVTTEPTGMFVALDGDERGVAPVFIDSVGAGEHELLAHGEGFIPRSVKIQVINGYKVNVEIKLGIDEQFKKKKEEAKKLKDSKTTSSKFIQVKNTPTGWLRVRSEPDVNASESAKVNPGEKYPYFEEKEGWFQIEYEKDARGWVLGDYVQIVEK